jgi:hypothetical protein
MSSSGSTPTRTSTSRSRWTGSDAGSANGSLPRPPAATPTCSPGRPGWVGWRRSGGRHRLLRARAGPVPAPPWDHGAGGCPPAPQGPAAPAGQERPGRRRARRPRGPGRHQRGDAQDRRGRGGGDPAAQGRPRHRGRRPPPGHDHPQGDAGDRQRHPARRAGTRHRFRTGYRLRRLGGLWGSRRPGGGDAPCAPGAGLPVVGAARGDQGPYPPPQAPHQPDRPRAGATFGIGFDGAAELLCAAGDNAGRIRSEAAYAKLCGACPIPASSGKTSRHRLNRGGNRQANAALFRIVVVRMRWHPATIVYVHRRTAEGLSKREIIRCLKRYVARQVYRLLPVPATASAEPLQAA